MKWSHQKLTPALGSAVTLSNGFWAERLRVYDRVTVADVFDKFEKDRGGAVNNFKRVRDGKSGYHAGPPWYDGLIYETIRGASDFLLRNPDQALIGRIDGYIDIMAQAQDKVGDGYINTYTTLICPENRWGKDGGSLLWQHDVYNAGCLFEAAVHYYRATGKTKLLRIAVRMANHMAGLMGPAPKEAIVSAHPLPEEALLRLYELFVEEPALKEKLDVPVQEADYLALVKFWLEARGHHDRRVSYPRYMGEYAQDHRPLLEQSEAVGHSVRAALLYAGIAQYANITGDVGYKAMARRIYHNVVDRKMHISGGIGAVHSEEKFGNEYQLPNTAYLETCASAALFFFAHNLHLSEGDGQYMDTMERALYNGILPGTSLKGDQYFYRNPLVSPGDEKRWAWHDCPCCPPMFLKVMGMLPTCLYSTAQAGVFVNLYASGSAALPLADGEVRIRQETQYPYQGLVKLTLEACPAQPFTLNLRIPGWCEKYMATVNGNKTEATIAYGYAAIQHAFAAGDTMELHLEMPVRREAAHPYVHDAAGRVALMRGPLLYCVEETDNDMQNIILPQSPVFELIPMPGLPEIQAVCFEDSEYRKVTAVPYFAWANRDIGKMEVWLKQEAFVPGNAQDWGENLYRVYRD